jgi:ribosomal-protein-alanine N-acetyltransferase
MARTTNDLALRIFEREDLDQVVAIEKACFPERPYTRDEFLLLMTQAGGGFLVAENDGTVVGYVTTVIEGGVGLIMSIAVSPQFRRRGIGDSLMKSALNHLSWCEGIWLLVDQKNVAAISLYHKHSFCETGRLIKGYYPNGDDAVEMIRTS